MKKNIYILAVLAVVFAACQPKDIEMNTLFKTDADVQAMLNAEPEGFVYYDEAHGGLNQFVADYMTEDGNFELVRSRASASGGVKLFSIDTIPAKGKGIYITGRVVTDDGGGNFYKALVIQQIVGGQQHALRISIDAGNASGVYAMGQQLLIRVNGLAIGKYANQPQLCVPGFNDNIYASHADEKVGWAPSCIPAARFAAAATLVGTPDLSKLYYEELNIADFTAITDPIAARNLDGKLVRVKNIHFTGEYTTSSGSLAKCTNGNPEEDSNANVFGPTTGNVGYPQGRVISDGSKNTLVSTSEYAKYAHMFLPDAEYVGTVEGVLGFYMDNGKYASSWDDWSISLRDLNDLKLSNGTNTWEPIEYGTK